MEYLERIVDAELAEALDYAGGVLVEGVRGCGKTRTSRQHVASWVHIDSDEAQVQEALMAAPRLLLDGECPRLIDEWQLAPQLWNIARRRIDEAGQKGMFIFTGSSSPSDDPHRHSGAHRFTKLRMRPMTLLERGIPAARVSLAQLFDHESRNGEPFEPTLAAGNIRDTFDAVAHGGWPGDVNSTTRQAMKFLRDYLDYVVSFDMNRLLGDVRRDPDRMRLVLASLARNVATEVNYSTIAADISRSRDISRNTVSQYISVLEQLFLVERQPAWTGQVRSKTAIRTSEKLHFADPALACALLGLNADGLMKDLRTAGFIFESAVFHHLAVIAQALGGTIYHYRDKAGREADAIITLPDGRWGVCEVKLGARAIPTAEKSLAAIVENFDTDAIGEPAFQAVITADGGNMRLPSGVYSLNLASLEP